MKYRVVIEGREREVDLDLSAWTPSGGTMGVLVDGAPQDVDVRAVPGGFSFRFGAALHEVLVHLDGTEAQLASGTARGVATVQSERAAAAKKKSGGGGRSFGELRAPMPGRVVRVLVETGHTVAAGQPMIVIEAMKMENELRAGAPGIVREVHVREGASVEGKSLLVTLDPA
jgi:glutaconyl-CoA/methylmalonyl-CoA decarboxylase subunit gamma